MGQCCLKRSEPTKADIMARFDRIQQKLQIVYETTDAAKKIIASASPQEGDQTSLRPIEQRLKEMEQALDRV